MRQNAKKRERERDGEINQSSKLFSVVIKIRFTLDGNIDCGLMGLKWNVNRCE